MTALPIISSDGNGSALTNLPSLNEALITFFEAQIRCPNTRRAYQISAFMFFNFARAHCGIRALEDVRPYHVSSWLDHMTAAGLSAPTVKQRLAAVKMLFQSLVRQRQLTENPADIVKGPSYSVNRGKTPILDGAETLRLLSAIDTSTLIGLRDRAMIATMAYSFARVSAVTSLKVQDVFRQRQRLWLRLTEKGGKSKDVPCHHQLEGFIADWLDVSGLRSHATAPLFQTFATRGARTKPADDDCKRSAVAATAHGKSSARQQRALSGQPMSQAMTWEMIQRRKAAAGIDTRVCSHTFRATGITAYLSNGGTIERAAAIAGHASTRTTQLYDRRPDDVTLDEIEKIRFA